MFLVWEGCPSERLRVFQVFESLEDAQAFLAECPASNRRWAVTDGDVMRVLLRAHKGRVWAPQEEPLCGARPE